MRTAAPTAAVVLWEEVLLANLLYFANLLCLAKLPDHVEPPNHAKPPNHADLSRLAKLPPRALPRPLPRQPRVRTESAVPREWPRRGGRAKCPSDCARMMGSRSR